jgi:hypothetical protein
LTDLIYQKVCSDIDSNAELAWVGKYINRLETSKRVDRKFPVGMGIANSDILKSYLAFRPGV